MGYINGNGLHMETDQTSAAMDTLGQAGTGFASAWAGVRGQITAAEAQLGKGELGQQFQANYGPASFSVLMQIEGECLAGGGSTGIADTVAKYATAGRGAVQDYISADARARAGMPHQ